MSLSIEVHSGYLLFQRIALLLLVTEIGVLSKTSPLQLCYCSCMTNQYNEALLLCIGLDITLYMYTSVAWCIALQIQQSFITYHGLPVKVDQISCVLIYCSYSYHKCSNVII